MIFIYLSFLMQELLEFLKNLTGPRKWKYIVKNKFKSPKCEDHVTDRATDARKEPQTE